MELFKLNLPFEDNERNHATDFIYLSSMSTDCFFQQRFMERSSKCIHDRDILELFSGAFVKKRLAKTNIWDVYTDRVSCLIFPKLKNLLLEPEEITEIPIQGFLPNIENYDTDDLSELCDQLDKNKELYCFDYAKGICSEGIQDYESALQYYRLGIHKHEHDCSAKMLKNYIENTKLNMGIVQNKYEEAVDVFVKAIYYSGLFYLYNISNQNVSLLKQFYSYMDLFREFRMFVLKKCIETIEIFNANVFDCFTGERYLLKRPNFIYDQILQYLIEPDYTSTHSIKILSLMELICQRKEFKSLALFVGDLYDNSFLGMCKLDLEKRLTFYSYTKSLENQLGVLRLASLTQYIFDQKLEKFMSEKNINGNGTESKTVPMSNNYDFGNSDNEDSGKKTDNAFLQPHIGKKSAFGNVMVAFEKRDNLLESGIFTNGNLPSDLLQIYKKMIKYNVLMGTLCIPFYLNFQIKHYIECNHFKLENKINEDICVSKIDSIQQLRQHALNKTIPFFQKLYVLGDVSCMVNYFRILRFQKYEESVIVAFKIKQMTDDEFYHMSLALCKEKGIGSKDEQSSEALRIYKKLLMICFKKDLKNQASTVMYRIAALMKRKNYDEGANIVIGKAFIQKILSNLSKNPTKIYAYELAKLLCLSRSIKYRNINAAVEIYKTAHDMSCKGLNDYITHYKIERELKKHIILYKSYTKGNDPCFAQISNTFISDDDVIAKDKKCQEKQIDAVGKLKKVFNMDTIDNQVDSHGKSTNKLETDVENELEFSLINFERFMDSNNSKDEEIRGLMRKNTVGNNKRVSMEMENKSISNLGEVSNTHVRDFIKYLKDMPNIRFFELSDIHVDNDINTLERIDDIHIYSAYLLKNKQMVRIFEVELQEFTDPRQQQQQKSKDFAQFKKDLQWMFLYNPLFVNFYGVCLSKLKSEKKILLVSEHFNEIGPACIFESNQRYDQKLTQMYHLVHAIRGLHFMGKPFHQLNLKYLTITERFDFKILIPFFQKDFDKPFHNIDQLSLASYYPPEAHDEKTRGMSDFYPVLDKGVKKELKRALAIDMWSLGVLFYEIFTNKHFIDISNYQNFQTFYNFYNNKSKLTKYINECIKKMQNIPETVKNLIQNLLIIEPTQRYNIYECLKIFERLIFHDSFGIDLLTKDYLNYQMFHNVNFRCDILEKNNIEIKKVIIYLPNNYTFEGECKGTIPEGNGKIYKGVASNVIMKGMFKKGIPSTKIEYFFGKYENLTFELDDNKIVPKNCKITYTLRVGRKIGREITNFHNDSWMVEEKDIMALWNEFLKVEDKVKESENSKDKLEEMPVDGLKKTVDDKSKDSLVENQDGKDKDKKEKEKKDKEQKKKDKKKKNEKEDKEVQELKKAKKKAKKELKKELMKESLKDAKYSTVIKNIEDYLEFFYKNDHELNFFFDPWGHCFKLVEKKKKEINKTKLKYDKGILIYHQEFSKMMKVSFWSPKIHPSRLFMSKIANYSIADCEKHLRTMNDQIQLNQNVNFNYCIITEFSKRQFRGKILHGELNTGTINFGNNEIRFFNGKDDSYYGEVLTKNNASRYEGGIIDQKKEGFGKYEEYSKTRYEGYFVDNQPHGKGILYDDNNKILFKGIFRDGLKVHGVSIKDEKLLSGSIYHVINKVNDPSWIYDLNTRPAFIDGVIEVNSKSPVVSGKFYDNHLQINGPSIVRYPDGGYYIGKLEGNRKEGHGVYIQNNGLRIIGNWYVYGVTGKVIFNKEHVIASSEGKFLFDEIGSQKHSGYGTVVLKDGTIYRGEMEDDEYHGHGRIDYPNGNYYEGQFQTSHYHGYGRIFYKEIQAECEGHFEFGKRSGPCIFKNILTEYKGYWIDDKMNFMIMDNAFCSSLKIGPFRINYLMSEVDYNEFRQEFNCKGYAYADLKFDLKGSKTSGSNTLAIKGDKSINESGICKPKEYYYYGQMFNNEIGGIGQICKDNDQLYEGEFREGRFHGYGRLTYKPRSYYLGQFDMGMQDGIGHYRKNLDNVCEGEFKQSKRHGLIFVKQKRDEVGKGMYYKGEKHGIFLKRTKQDEVVR